MVSPVLATWQRNWSKIGHTSFFPLFSKSVGVRMAREEWRNRRQKDKKKNILKIVTTAWTTSTTLSETPSCFNNTSVDPNSSSNFPALGNAAVFSRGETRAPGRQKLVRDFWGAAAVAAPPPRGRDSPQRPGRGELRQRRARERREEPRARAARGLRAHARPSPSLQRTPGRPHPRDPAASTPEKERSPPAPGSPRAAPHLPSARGHRSPTPRRSRRTTFQRLLQPLDVHDPRPRPPAALRAAPLRRPPPTPHKQTGSRRRSHRHSPGSATFQHGARAVPVRGPDSPPSFPPGGGGAREAGPRGPWGRRPGAGRSAPRLRPGAQRRLLAARPCANRRENCGKSRMWGTLFIQHAVTGCFPKCCVGALSERTVCSVPRTVTC